MKINEKLKLLRAEHNYSMEYVGKMVGTSKQNIARYENGTITNIPYNKILSLASLYNCTPGYLMGWEDNIENDDNIELLPDLLCDDDLLECVKKIKALNEADRKTVYDYVDFISSKKA